MKAVLIVASNVGMLAIGAALGIVVTIPEQAHVPVVGILLLVGGILVLAAMIGIFVDTACDTIVPTP